MENKQLPWKSDFFTEKGKELGEQLGIKKGQLGLILLVADKDSKDCCAKNFERTLFRDPKLVKFARKSLVSFRLDRTQNEGQELYKRFKLNDKKPSIILVDTDSELLYKTQKCTEPKTCLKVMGNALVHSKKKLIYSARTAKKMSKIEALIKDRDFSDALYALKNIKSPKLLVLSLRRKLESIKTGVAKEGAKRNDLARRFEKRGRFPGDFEKARKIYKYVSKEFSRVKELKDEAKKGLRRVDKRLKERKA